MRVPLGVVGVIYESRPNVTADAAGLCLKSGNAVILKGGSEAFATNTRDRRLPRRGQSPTAGLPAAAVQLIPTTDRQRRRRAARASASWSTSSCRAAAPSLIEAITESVEHSGHPALRRHLPRLRRRRAPISPWRSASPSTPRCSARASATRWRRCSCIATSPSASCRRSRAPLRAAGVELRGCPRTRAVLPDIAVATEEDWRTEYLDLILSVKVVDSLDDAIDFINTYGTGHSDAIVTDSYAHAQRFTAAVDSAAVYVNASTRFTDGFEFGFGAEVGISTNRLHARGPMGLRELTTYKYVIHGSGQIRS